MRERLQCADSYGVRELITNRSVELLLQRHYDVLVYPNTMRNRPLQVIQENIQDIFQSPYLVNRLMVTSQGNENDFEHLDWLNEQLLHKVFDGLVNPWKHFSSIFTEELSKEIHADSFSCNSFPCFKLLLAKDEEKIKTDFEDADLIAIWILSKPNELCFVTIEENALYPERLYVEAQQGKIFFIRPNYKVFFGHNAGALIFGRIVFKWSEDHIQLLAS